MSWDPLRHQSLHHDIVGSDVIYDIIRNDVINLVFMYGLVSMLNLVFMYSLVLVYWFPLTSSIPAPCMTCSSGIINDIIGNDIINLGCMQASYPCCQKLNWPTARDCSMSSVILRLLV